MKRIILACLLISSSAVAFGQKKVELGIFGDFVNMNHFKKDNGGGNLGDFKISNPPLSVGAYLNLYAFRYLGFQIGLQYVSATDGSVTYNTLNSPQIGDRTYTYNYRALRIPIALTGDINNWIYYVAGVNFHIDQSEIVDGPDTEELINGIGVNGELGIHRSLLTNSLVVRLGFTAQSENTFAINNTNFNIMDWGLRLRLGLRL